MKTNIKYYFISAILFMFCSCDEVVDSSIEQPEGEKLVLIYGFISPDVEEIVVSVSETISIFDPDLDSLIDDSVEERLVIKNAVVTIENAQGESVQLDYNMERRRYIAPSSAFAFEAGEEYFLSVIAKGKEYTASCVIPVKKIEDFETSLGIKTDQFGSASETVTIKFDDISGEVNYYIVGAKYGFGGETDPSEFSDAFFDIEQFATDINGDGLPVISDGVVFGVGNEAEVLIQITHVDELIHNTLKAEFLNENGGVESDPFFQPVVPPSNIEGDDGFGVFAGYRYTERQETLTLQ